MDVNIIREVVTRTCLGEDLVLVTIIKVTGSTPRETGTQMLVLSSGSIYGTIGGGPGEEAARKKALEMLKKKIPFQKLKLELNLDLQAQEGMVCGGKQEIMLELLRGEENPDENE